MTKLIVNAVQVLDEDIQDGVVSLSSSDIQYSYGRLVLPEFQREKLVNGQAVFDNVAPGKVIAQFAWDHNRTATVRATVPDTDSITLAELTLQQYDREPAVVSQMTKAVTDIENSLVEMRGLRNSATESASQAGEAETGAQNLRDETEGLRDDAQTASAEASEHRQGALTYREGSKEHKEAAEAAKSGAETARDAAEGFRDGAKAHRDTAKLAEDNAATSATAANTSANEASGSAPEAEQRLQEILEVASGAEDVEQRMIQLLEDTEAWSTVQSALEKVDIETADAIAQVKEEILGGADPAYDTLAELADALGNNADAIAAITDQLAKKAEKEHTHTSADITDAAHYLGGDAWAGRVVKTHSNGHIYTREDPPSDDALARKAYVDKKTAVKSDKGHKHVIEDTSGLQTALDGKAPIQHIHSVSEVDGLEAKLGKKADTDYVDAEVSKQSTALAQTKLQIIGRPALFHGYGPPGTIAGAVIGDKYLDLDAMEVHILGGA